MVNKSELRVRFVQDAFTAYYIDSHCAARIPQETLLSTIVPFLADIITNAPKEFKRVTVPLLLPGCRTNSAISRRHITIVLACLFFGLLEFDYILTPPTRGKRRGYTIDDFPDLSFAPIFINRNLFALQCLLGYFAMAHVQWDNKFAQGQVVIMRTSLSEDPNDDLAVPSWSESQQAIADIYISNEAVDVVGSRIQIVNASEMIGKGSWGGPLTNEEIQMIVHPESIIASLICARLDPNECVVVLGAARISQYTGVGSNIRYTGPCVDPLEIAVQNGRSIIRHAMVFIDASNKTDATSQCIYDFNRDLNKAYCGFAAIDACMQVSCAHWTYGFNGGHVQVRFLQLLLAASHADKQLVYHTNNPDIEPKIEQLYDWIQERQLTVGDLYKRYKALIHSRDIADIDVFDELIDADIANES